MVTVTVYSKKPCVQCDATYRELDKRGVTYTVKDVTDPENAEALKYFTDEIGYSSAPIVVVDQDQDHHWSGFRPDLIKKVAASGV